MTLQAFLPRLLVAPRIVGALLADRVLTPLWLRALGVRVGPSHRFRGCPIVRRAPDAQIVLGENVLIISRPEANAAGIAHPTMLDAGRGSSISIGTNTGISGASIVAQSGTGIRIGERVLIGAGACIWDTDFHPLDPESRRRHPTRGAATAPITIEDDVFVGGRALILKGVTLGRGAVIGAGAVVARSVPAGSIVVGNPARVIGHVNLQPVAAMTDH